MANFCLPKFAADAFKEKLTSGAINPGKLADMTSEERHNFFKGFLGEENAKQTNALFESKLLLKDQQAGIIRWAKSVSGLNPEAQKELIARVQKLDKVLNPAEEKAFLADLAEKKLGVGVSAEEAKTISELAQKADQAKQAIANGGDRLEYGRAKVAFGNYVSDLKNAATKPTLKERAMDPLGTLKTAGGFTKSLKASLDDSALFRQGWKTMFTNPGIWAKNSAQSFMDIAHAIGGKNVLDEVNADIVSRPTFDAMKKAKLAVGVTEESYPSHLAEKIPALGRLYKASESAYTGFIQRTRADVFDKYLQIAEKSGIDITDKKELEGIGKVVNALTGRGNLGALEPAADAVNNIFFSPRNLKSNIDLLTAHALDKGITPFARKQAATNLVKVVAGTASVLGIANALLPGSVEWDPRSADFGKIRVGNTRFDVSGGMSSIVTLAARLATQSSKSSTTGKVSKLNARDKKGNPKFGAQTGADVLVNFTENKLSPIGQIVLDLLKQNDRTGNKPTVLGEANNLLTPLPITNTIELNTTPGAANALLGTIADALGISVNSYAPKK
jgi:hypothetical protein